MTFCMHLLGDMKDVSFNVFNNSKLLLFCISLTCVDSMSCFPFCIQIFIFAPNCLPQPSTYSLHRYILTDLFIPPLFLSSLYAFLCPPASLLCSREQTLFQLQPNCLLAHLWCHSFQL